MLASEFLQPHPIEVTTRVTTRVTLNIRSQVFDLSLAEAKDLLESLQRAVGHVPTPITSPYLFSQTGLSNPTQPSSIPTPNYNMPIWCQSVTTTNTGGPPRTTMVENVSRDSVTFTDNS